MLIFHNDKDFVMDGKNMRPAKKALKNLSTAVGESKLFNHIYLYKPDIIKVKSFCCYFIIYYSVS